MEINAPSGIKAGNLVAMALLVSLAIVFIVGLNSIVHSSTEASIEQARASTLIAQERTERERVQADAQVKQAQISAQAAAETRNGLLLLGSNALPWLGLATIIIIGIYMSGRQTQHTLLILEAQRQAQQERIEMLLLGSQPNTNIGAWILEDKDRENQVWSAKQAGVWKNDSVIWVDQS